jgi:hypothetical protein
MQSSFFPLKAFSAYIAFTVLLALLGPVTYVDFKSVQIAAYMGCFLGIFALGYTAGTSIKVPTAPYSQFGEEQALQVVKLCILTSFLYKCQELIFLPANVSLDLSVEAIGEAYANYYGDYVRGSGNYDLKFIVGIFFYLPLQVTLILGLYYFRRLSNTYKLLVLGTIILLILVNVFGQGKQKQFGDVLIFGLSVLALKIATYKRSRLRILFGALAVGSAGVLVLLVVLYSRYSALDLDIENINRVTHPLLAYDAEHPTFKVLGNTAGLPVAVFCMYLTGGYQGLSLAFDQPFVWTHGIGHSYALTVFVNKVLGLPASVLDSYPYRVGAATAWDEAKWHSAFAWFASDLTFVGALLLFVFVAYIYAQCWKEAVMFNNPTSIMLFSVLNLGLVFVPANNQLFHSPESYLSVILVFTVWALTRGGFNAGANKSLPPRWPSPTF